MSKESDSIFDSGEAVGHSPSFPDVSPQTERALWWAEFDSVGEEAVRGYVERNSYTPTGMEVARQWLAQRELLQLREDVQSVRALAEQAQEIAAESLGRESETLTLASQLDANRRVIAEIAADAKKNARTMAVVGTVACLFALCAIAMVLTRPSSQQAAPNTKQASAQPSLPKPAAAQPPPAAVPPAMPTAEPPAETQHPPENAQMQQPSNPLPIASPDLKPEGQSAAGALALIADKVGSEGPINFTAQVHDKATGRDHTERLSYKASNVTIDPNRCQVGYRWHVEQNGRAVSDQDRAVELRLAKSIRMTSIDAEPGQRFSMRTDPKVHVVHIARWDNAAGDNLYFHDKGMAARVGTAIRQAVELCDNGEPRRR